MSRFFSHRQPQKNLPKKIISSRASRGIRRWAIALICTLSFNPVALQAVWGQTAQPIAPETQAKSQQFLIAQEDSEPKSETSSNPPFYYSKTGTNWPSILPPLLSRYQKSEIVSQPVRLDGRTLFSVAPLTQDRGEIIEGHLKIVLQRTFDPKTLKVYFQILNRLPVIYVSWSNEPEPIYILTVTTVDAEFQGVDSETLANQWTKEIQQALHLAYQERQPEAVKKQGMRAGIVIFIMGLSSFSLISIRQLLQKKHEQIMEQMPTEPEVNSPDRDADIAEDTEKYSEASEAMATLLNRRITLLQKRNFNEIEQGMVTAGQVGLWGFGTYITLGIFPYSRWLQTVIISVLPIPIQLVIVAISSYVGIRLSGIAINRFFAALENRNFQSASNSQRLTLRFSTFSSVFKNLSSGLIIGVGILVSLSAIGVNIGPLLAGAGILGLGISLGSQNLIKDTINGFFILLEDQYAVGDVIVVGDVGGLVENMNLRITQLRNGEGRLITIPNSAITVVQNLSKEWARVDLTLDVSYQSDVEQALATIQEVVDDIYNETEWREKIIAPPQVLGIDRMDHAGIMIRVWIRVKPLQHWIVGRECRRRLKPRLDAAGISIGTPQRTLLFNNSLELLSLKDEN